MFGSTSRRIVSSAFVHTGASRRLGSKRIPDRSFPMISSKQCAIDVGCGATSWGPKPERRFLLHLRRLN